MSCLSKKGNAMSYALPTKGQVVIGVVIHSAREWSIMELCEISNATRSHVRRVCAWAVSGGHMHERNGMYSNAT